TSTVRGRKSTSRRAPATAVARTMVSPWRTTTAPEACLAILPVSREISLPATSTETRVTASLLIFSTFLFRPSVGGPFLLSRPEQTELSGPGRGARTQPRDPGAATRCQAARRERAPDSSSPPPRRDRPRQARAGESRPRAERQTRRRRPPWARSQTAEGC